MVSKDAENINNNLKVVLLGESGVGKTNIVKRFISNQFSTNTETTLGANFYCRTFKGPGSRGDIKYEIWDTAGQEVYRGLTRMYYRNARAALLVYDISSESTFAQLDGWLMDLRTFAPENLLIVIVGNKSDLFEEEAVDVERATNYAKANGALFRHTSAKDNLGINDLFFDIAEKLEEKEKFAKYRNQGTHTQLTKETRSGSRSPISNISTAEEEIDEEYFTRRRVTIVESTQRKKKWDKKRKKCC